MFKISGSDFPAMMTYGYSTFGGKKITLKELEVCREDAHVMGK